MKIESINSRTLEALRNRRLTDEKIQSMSADELFYQYCNWNGLIGWGHDLIDALDNLRAAAKE